MKLLEKVSSKSKLLEKAFAKFSSFAAEALAKKLIEKKQFKNKQINIKKTIKIFILIINKIQNHQIK